MNHEGILEEFSGQYAKRLVAEIIKHHRVPGSPGLTDAAHYVNSVAHQVGLAEVELKEYEIDGHSRWWTWTKPWHWTPRAAELHVVAPQNILLARFQDEPCSLVAFSGSTPPTGITAEVVDVGQGLEGADYEGKNIEGKFVLLSGTQWSTWYATRLAQEKGAIGIIVDNIIEFPPFRTRVDVPDLVGYNTVRVNADGSSLPGFSINHKQMLLLKKLLTKGQVTVHAYEDAVLGAGKLPLVTGVIKGQTNPDEEVVLIAHLCHPAPSANDNASGSAMLLEFARALISLIKKGKLAAPKRTLRFMWVSEFSGPMAYLHENETWSQSVKAVLSCDAVGEDQIKCGGPLVVDKTPDTVPSFLNDLIEHYLEILSEDKLETGAIGLWKYRMEPFGGGSDHVPFVDSDFAIPGILIFHEPDLFYHSSGDTLDKVDPIELEKVAWAVSEVVLGIANAGGPDAELFAKETFGRSLQRLHQKTQEILWQLKAVLKSQNATQDEQKTQAEQIGGLAKKGIDILRFRLQVEQGALESVLTLVPDPDQLVVQAKVERLQEELVRQTQQFIEGILEFAENLGGIETRTVALQEIRLSKEERELQRIIPHRKWKGLLDLKVTEHILGWERTRWLAVNQLKCSDTQIMLKLASFWVDGTRNMWNIAQNVHLGTGIEVDLNVLQRYFENLQESGLVELEVVTYKSI